MKTKVTVREQRTTVREKIINLLRKASKPLDAKTIAKRGKLNYNTVRKELGRMYSTMSDFYSTVRVAGKNEKPAKHLRHYHVGAYC